MENEKAGYPLAWRRDGAVRWNLSGDGVLTIAPDEPDEPDTPDEPGTLLRQAREIETNRDAAPWTGQKIVSVTIEPGITKIGWRAFCGCTSLASVRLPAGVTEIGPWALAFCTALGGLCLPEGVRVIGESAFQGCAALTAVAFPAGVREIGWGAFCGCAGLTAVFLPDSVGEIGFEAFAACGNLREISIPPGARFFRDSFPPGAEIIVREPPSENNPLNTRKSMDRREVIL